MNRDGCIRIVVRGAEGRGVARTYWLPNGEISTRSRDELVFQVKSLYWDTYGTFPHAQITAVDVEATGPYGPITFPEIPRVTLADYCS